MKEKDKVQIELEGDNHLMTSIDTPMLKEAFDKSDQEKIEIIQEHFAKIMTTLQTLEHDMNRSTVYRTLETLREKNLFLKMIDSKGIAFYTVNLKRKCQNNIHPHLKCNSCGGVICLPAFPSEYIQTLERAGVNNLDVVLNGICPNCN